MGTLISRFIDNSTVLDKPGKDYTILQRVQVNSKGTTLLEDLTLKEEGEGNCQNWIQRGITLFAVITKLGLLKLLKVVLTSLVIMGLILLLLLVAFERGWLRGREERRNSTYYVVECGPVSYSGFLDLWREKEIFVHGILYLVVLEACLALEGIWKGSKLLNSKLPILRIQPTPKWISGIIAVLILTILFVFGAALGTFTRDLFYLANGVVSERGAAGEMFTRRDFAQLVFFSVFAAFWVAVRVRFVEWIFSSLVFVLVQCFGGSGRRGGKRGRNNNYDKNDSYSFKCLLLQATGNDLGWLGFGRIAGLILLGFWLIAKSIQLVESCDDNERLKTL